jgi:predicted  nucleic acid-binding Zn-ribbon protein
MEETGNLSFGFLIFIWEKAMQESLGVILKIQELDIKMIRLVRVKKERLKELEKLQGLKGNIQEQVTDKEKQVLELKKDIRMCETQVKEIQERVAKLDAQATAVKKMDEFNALTQEITSAGREKTLLEQRTSDMLDKLAVEEDSLVSLKESLSTADKNSQALEKEIAETIQSINQEGSGLLKEREVLVTKANPEIFKIYERLLKNKKDRVVVPIENRTCSGCHIVLTAQHENLVRKGDRLIFCEHCSRILYWQEVKGIAEGDEATTRRRRKRAVVAAT